MAIINLGLTDGFSLADSFRTNPANMNLDLTDGFSYAELCIPQVPLGWLGTWEKRIKLTLNHNDIDGILADFPVLVYLSSNSGINNTDVTSVFDEVGANRKKIAVTKSDGKTQCYVEIEKWDLGNEKAWLHIKVPPPISSVTDTVLYLYYDNSQADNTTYVGDPSDAVVHNVWDANFKLVTHMRDDPDTSHVRDSTVNANDGTKKGANEPIVTTAGKIDDAQDFDGTDDEISIPNITLGSGSFSMGAWIRTTDTGVAYVIANYDYNVTQNATIWVNHTANKATFAVVDAAVDFAVTVSTTSVNDGNWHYVRGVRDGNTIYIYVDGGDAEDSADASAVGSVDAGYWRIGHGYGGPADRHFDGIIDEVCVSTTARSAAWIKTSYESGRDDLIAFGTQEIYKPLTDGYTLADPLSIQEVYYRTLKDAFNYADPLTRLLTRRLTLKDAFDYADILSKMEEYYLSLKDAFTYADILSKLEEYYLSLRDSFDYADFFSRLKTRRLVLEDAFDYADILSTQEIYYRSLLDGYLYMDDATKVLRVQWLLYLSDYLTFADVTSTQEVFYRALIDGYTYADIVSIQEVYYRSLVDAYPFADVLSRQEIYYQTLEDAFEYADILGAQEVYNRTLKDAFNYADILSKLEEYYLSLKDAFDYADPLTRLLTRRLVLEDDYTFADVLSRREIFNRYILDGYAFADVLSKGEIFYLSLIDAFIHQSVAIPPQISLFRIAPTLPKTIAESLEGVPLPLAKTIAQHLEKLLNP